MAEELLELLSTDLTDDHAAAAASEMSAEATTTDETHYCNIFVASELIEFALTAQQICIMNDSTFSCEFF